MTITAEADNPSAQRLPWPATAAALVAFASLYVSGGGFLGLPALALLLAGTQFTAARLPAKAAPAWTLRVGAFTLVILGSGERQPSGVPILFDPDYIYLFGYLIAAELVLRAWLRRSGGPSRGEIMLLTALVFTASTNTFDPRFVRWFAPLFTAFLALSLRDLRPRDQAGVTSALAPTRRTAVGLRAGALLAALAVGATAAGLLGVYGEQLTRWSVTFLSGQRAQARVGVSASPALGRTFNAEASARRVLRVEGLAGEGHLRGMAFETYARGVWGPAPQARVFRAAPPEELKPAAPGRRLRFERFADEFDLLYLPLGSAGVAPAGDVETDRAGAGILRTVAPAEGPYEYSTVLPPDPDAPGPLNVPPAAEQRAEYLAVPEEIDPAVRELAARVGGDPEPAQRVRAIERYLQSNHRYSFAAETGLGDPVSDFLLHKRAAHCQYFASAAVLLLRCTGLPARYVNGYYAHESAPGGGAVVRQRDAHAWAECWVDGKGWLTIDATPSAGRPDEVYPEAPAWRGAWEWAGDQWRLFRSWMTRGGWKPLALSAGAAALLWGGARAWLARRRAPRHVERAYETRDVALSALSERFERLLKREGVACPPTRTWQEHLAALPGPETEEARTILPPAMYEFLGAYNAARFGGPDPSRLATVIAALRTLEEQGCARSPARD